MRIGIDLDGVLADSYVAFRKYLQREHPLETYGFETNEEMFIYFRKFISSPEHNNIKPMFLAQYAVGKLREYNDLYIITNRHHNTCDHTEKWVKRHFPNCFKDIWYNQLEHNNGKLVASRSIGIGLLIDDDIRHIEGVNSIGISGIHHYNWKNTMRELNIELPGWLQK